MCTKLQQNEIKFSNGATSKVIYVDRDTPAHSILDALDLSPFPHAVIPISGGAKYLSPNGFSRIFCFVNAVVELAYEKNIMLVDGGTQTGVMEVVGNHFGHMQRDRKNNKIPPLVGFTPLPLIKLPDNDCTPDDIVLEPNHPYFILVRNAHEWGEEVETMFSLVNTVTEKIPSISLIVNGGLTTLKEAVLNIRNGREIVVLDGGYRATKLIFAALKGEKSVSLERILLDDNEHLIDRSDPDWKSRLRIALDQLSEISSYDRISGFNHDRSPEDLKYLLSSKLGFNN